VVVFVPPVNSPLADPPRLGKTCVPSPPLFLNHPLCPVCIQAYVPRLVRRTRLYYSIPHQTRKKLLAQFDKQLGTLRKEINIAFTGKAIVRAKGRIPVELVLNCTEVIGIDSCHPAFLPARSQGLACLGHCD